MTSKGKGKRKIAWVVLALSICAMAAFGYKLRGIQQVYKTGAGGYERLAERVRPGGAPQGALPLAAATDTGTGAAALAKVWVPPMGIDFNLLKSINEDASAWLYCPDTVIDYPVMRAGDYDHYLHYLPDGAYNANGSLFIDYNNAPDFSDSLTVIYGHHMKSGQMFGSLKGYKGQEYFENHPYMYLYTEQGDYRIDLMYGCVIAAGEWRERAFMYDLNLDALLDYAASNTTFESGVGYAKGDRVVAMSTCSYEFNDARYVVLGILRS